MFAVVEFSDEVAVSVVPESWLIGGRKCCWPPEGTQGITKLVLHMCRPKDTWQKVDCTIKKRKIRTYEKAREYERLYEMETELDESEDDSRRRRRSPIRFIPKNEEVQHPRKSRAKNSSDSEEDESLLQQVQEKISKQQEILLQKTVAAPRVSSLKSAKEDTKADSKEDTEADSKDGIGRLEVDRPVALEMEVGKPGGIMDELKRHRRVLESILTENKKQSHYLRKISKESVDGPILIKEEPVEMIVTSFDGSTFAVAEIPSGNPSKFALEFLRKLKGPDYLSSHICEPLVSRRSKKTTMDDETVKLLKKALSATFDKFSWSTIKNCINSASRDANRRKIQSVVE